MTLPPLPEPHLLVFDAALQSPIDGWTRSQVEAYARAAVEAEREAILFECVPGGSICDPQQIADAIRARGAKEQGND